MNTADLPDYVQTSLKMCDAYTGHDPAVWIRRLNADELAGLADNKTGPLSGLTFAIKDNIDLGGVPTTAACPGYEYTPVKSATVVSRLMAAGAVPLGKTNLDQFATGLVGTRSPYGVPRNVFNRDYISGGSSSGSAVAVAAGLVDFALGTDTAGSGRVPASFNGIVGLKPTRGRLSTSGVVPACRSLDCVSIFSRTAAVAQTVLRAAEGFDEADPFSRQKPNVVRRSIRRLGVPRADRLEWFGNVESPKLFANALERLRECGVELVEVDFSAFLEAAKLLYEGPWTAERYAAVGEFIERNTDNPDAGLDGTVAAIIAGGKTPNAVAGFRATYRLAELRREAEKVLATVDALVAPTTGTIYTVAEIEADPVRLNSNLGRYNNFMNLLDLCGLTLSAGRYSFGPGFGITLIGEAWQDEALLELGARYLGEALPESPCGDEVILAVCGAHLRGQPLHHQLTDLGARFLCETTTSARYRFYALASLIPAKPGLVRVNKGENGAPITVETYALSAEAFGKFTAAVPAPLVIGNAELADGSWVKSFLCEPCALTGATDITAHGGWVAYRKMG